MHAFLDGIRRVAASPPLVLGVYGLTLIAALPLGLAVRDAIADDLGASLAAQSVAAGVDWTWWEEFLAGATGVARTFTPRIIGAAAVLTNLGELADARPPHGAVLLAIAVYLAAWTFLGGGIIDRLARRRRLGGREFFAACGMHWFRLARLAVLAGAVYWLLFGAVHGWLFDGVYDGITRDFTAERTSVAVRVLLYAAFALLVLPVNLTFDYARIRTVVEDRRSALGALLAALRFVRRHPAGVATVYLLNAGLFVAVVAAYAAAATALDLATAGWSALLVGQAYILARVVATLVFSGSQIAYFQSQLAHAGYVATPRLAWPESPAAEAVTRSAR